MLIYLYFKIFIAGYRLKEVLSQLKEYILYVAKKISKWEKVN